MSDVTTGPSRELLDELAEVNAALEFAPASKAIEWALGRFGQSLVVACSFQDVVVVDLVRAYDPHVEVVFLDTGAHFAETLDMVQRCQERYGLHLTVTQPVGGAEDWPCATARCCEFRKVAPLRQALAGRSGWISGLKRVDGPSRASIPTVSYDDSFDLVKVNPLATWSDEDIFSYERDHDLPVHPLLSQGYRSIGCAPTTRPVDPGEDARAGRWAGSAKTECGLHG